LWSKKMPRAKGGLTYPSFVVCMCLELLALGVRPACIGAVIIAVASNLCPAHNVEETFEDPSVPWLRELRVVLLCLTKTLAAFQVAGVDNPQHILTDGTSCRRTEMDALMVGFMTDNGYRALALLSCIFSENKSAEATHIWDYV
jgi:hypothetical protein